MNSIKASYDSLEREGKASALILQGFWLLHAGFAPGDKVALDVTNGKIVITKGE